jgi:phosphate transport system protein
LTQVGPRPARRAFGDELDELHLQVELLCVRVDQALTMTRDVLRGGDTALAQHVVEADDEIDAMDVSLTERCHDILRLEGPVASDLRLVVSVLRIVGELERIGDLCLRIVLLAEDVPAMRAGVATWDVLQAMADEAVERFRLVVHAWSARDERHAADLAGGSPLMTSLQERLLGELLAIDGADAVRTAIPTLLVGRSLDRIVDHTAIIGARLRYLIDGDPAHLAEEVR